MKTIEQHGPDDSGRMPDDAPPSRASIASPHATDLRVVRTTRNVHEAFLRLLETMPMRKITVSALANEAGINRRTFYLHYSSLSDVIEEISEKLMAETTEAIAHIDIMESREKIADLYRLLDQVTSDHRSFFDNVLADENARSFFDTWIDQTSAALVGRYAKTTELPPEELALYLAFETSGILSVYVAWVKSGRSVPLERAAAVAYNATRIDALVVGSSPADSSDSEVSR